MYTKFNINFIAIVATFCIYIVIMFIYNTTHIEIYLDYNNNKDTAVQEELLEQVNIVEKADEEKNTLKSNSEKNKENTKKQEEIKTESKQESKTQNKQENNKENTKKSKTEKTGNDTSKIEIIGKIKIPKISLTATIAEGTTEQIMNRYVGHFADTSFWDGNIGLAAHNRGYPVNYFENVKELKKGDEIIYETNNGKRTYIVETTTIIKDTDWSYLAKTNDNRITLITCVENEPEYRRCVQGIEKI